VLHKALAIVVTHKCEVISRAILGARDGAGIGVIDPQALKALKSKDFWKSSSFDVFSRSLIRES
jgi:hypothetical protein